MSSSGGGSGGNDIFQSMKKASQRLASVVADTGAKTLLKTDMVFLERDIKSRKQAFGLEVYDILASKSMSSSTASTSLCSEEVQVAFEKCKVDIDALENKLHVKKKERDAIDNIILAGGDAGAASGSGSGAGGMEDKETPGIPATL